MDCNSFTEYTGLDPNDQTLTAEEKMQACMSYRDYIMNTFVPEMNAAMPQICASGQVKLENYVGEADVCIVTDPYNPRPDCEDKKKYAKNSVVRFYEKYYRAMKDNIHAYVFTDSYSLEYVGEDWMELPIFPISGSNANGRWVKFGDGTLLQYGVNAIFPTDIQLPYQFINVNYHVTATGVNDTSPVFVAIREGVTKTETSFNMIGYNQGGEVAPIWANWIAIGRWK